MKRLSWVVALPAALAACGGSVTDDSGSGGTGGTGGSGDGCTKLWADYQARIAEMVKCAPELLVYQCTGKARVYDSCGCKGVLVNDFGIGHELTDALDVYDAWVKAGCGPAACDAACVIGDAGVCDKATKTCKWQ